MSWAQVPAPIGIVRGEMVQWTADSKSNGEFTVRTADQKIYECHFDGFSYMERDGQRIAAAALKAGDKLEIIADEQPGAAACYARTIRVVYERAGVVNPGYRVNLRPPAPRTSTADLLFPRGNMTFAGVVIRMNPEAMVVRTRTDGERIVRLRQDTRYMDSGTLASRAALPVNTRVFVRAGRNLDDEVEAYQVIWGEIDGPK